MSLVARMTANVGDTDPVWRYLLEKIGHTALIAWTLINVFSVDPLIAACVATGAYLVVGKALWLLQAYKRAQKAGAPGLLDESNQPVRAWTEVKDFVFDAHISAIVIVLAARHASGALASAACFYLGAAWVVTFLIMDNNKLGRPS